MFLLVGLYFFKTMNKYSQSKKSVHKCFTIIKKTVTVAIAVIIAIAIVIVFYYSLYLDIR